jgi:hypothetical protein
MKAILRFNKIAAILKKSFINEAKIIMEVRPTEILAHLIGKFSFGNQQLGGALYRLEESLSLNSDSSKSVWIQHKGIDSSAYRGLGYARDLMVAGITEVSNNNGVVISIDSVSQMAQEHNIRSSNAGFNTKVVVLWNNVLWDNPEDLILEFPNGEDHKEKLAKAFLQPYERVLVGTALSSITIESGLLISISTAKCSLPISYQDGWEDYMEKNKEVDLPRFYRNDSSMNQRVKEINSELSQRADYIRSIRNISKTKNEIRTELYDELDIIDSELKSAKDALEKDPYNNSARQAVTDLTLKRDNIKEKFYNM